MWEFQKKGGGAESSFKETMAENFPKLRKMDIQINEIKIVIKLG
jgi:hypothetical protein